MKTCKYGHGQLHPADGIWALPQMEKKKDDQGMVMATHIDLGYVYSVKIYQCPTCGYVEFFDDEVQDGD